MHLFKTLIGAVLGAALWIGSVAPSAAQDVYAWRRMYPAGYNQYVAFFQPYLVRYYRTYQRSGGWIDYDLFTTLWFNVYVNTLVARANAPRTVQEQQDWFNRYQFEKARKDAIFQRGADAWRREFNRR